MNLVEQLISDATGSKTLKQSIFAVSLWSIAAYMGVFIPEELVMVLVGGIALKEGAGKLRKK